MNSSSKKREHYREVRASIREVAFPIALGIVAGNGAKVRMIGPLPGAVCAQTDPELFFPEDEDYAAANTARELCLGCPLLTLCIHESLNLPPHEGINGGMAKDERTTILRLASEHLAAQPVLPEAMPEKQAA